MRRPTGSSPAKIAHACSVILMAAAVIIATADGFAQSWAGLYGWGVEAGLTEWKAMSFPGLVDLFILVGELGLFALALEGHRLRKTWLSWTDVALPATIAAIGWAASLAFNIAHVHGWREQVTAAVPPIASMLGLLVLLRTLHRLVSHAPPAPAEMVTVTAEAVVETAPDIEATPPIEEPKQRMIDQHRPPVVEVVDAGQSPDMPPVRADTAASTATPTVRELATLAGRLALGRLHRMMSPPLDHATAQPAVTDLSSAVRAAAAAGLSERKTAEKFGISRYRVTQILSEPQRELVAVNGHNLNGDLS